MQQSIILSIFNSTLANADEYFFGFGTNLNIMHSVHHVSYFYDDGENEKFWIGWHKHCITWRKNDKVQVGTKCAQCLYFCIEIF